MRILHTSDWHLGAAFHDQARDDEEDRLLEALVQVAGVEAVDAVLIAGDIFDTVNPPAAAQARYYRTVLRLVREAGVGTVVVIGGNHDHGLRLDGPAPLMAELRIQVRGQLLREALPESVIVPLFTRSGVIGAWCAAVPYLRDADLTTVPMGLGYQAVAQLQADAQSARLAAVNAVLSARAQGLPMVAMAHAFAAGGTLGGSERPVSGEWVDTCGRLSRADMSPLAEGCAYLALGHLHRAQSVGRQHWRYCGSLLPMGFDEINQPRQVVIADVTNAENPAEVRAVPLHGARAYARLNGNPNAVRAGIQALTPPAAGELEPWCDVLVELALPDPSLVSELENRIRGRGWKALAIRRCVPQRADHLPASMSPETLPDLQQLDPSEVFTAAHRAMTQSEPDAELQSAFAAVLHAVRSAEH